MVAVACGGRHSVAVTDAGQLYTWGRGFDGQLGTGGTEDVRQPQQVNFADRPGERQWRRLRSQAAKQQKQLRQQQRGRRTTKWASIMPWQSSSPSTPGRRSPEPHSPAGATPGSEPTLPLDAAQDKRVVAVGCGGSHTACVMGPWNC